MRVLEISIRRIFLSTLDLDIVYYRLSFMFDAAVLLAAKGYRVSTIARIVMLTWPTAPDQGCNPPSEMEISSKSVCMLPAAAMLRPRASRASALKRVV